jgi:hypothetical protein
MSDRRDNGPLRLPPEREVTPQLRARVLHQAMREDRRPERKPTRIAPVLAGLTAAAVVVGVVYAVSQDGGAGSKNGTNNGAVGQPVAAHDVVQTVVRTVPDDKVAPIKDRCGEATGVDAKYRMTTELLRSPIGRIDAGAYSAKNATPPTRIFCTPFASIAVLPGKIVTAQEPVRLIEGSRVQGLLPRHNPDKRAYFDGAWFAVLSGVKAIEARLVVDGVPQTWHQAESTHAYVFASAWAPLTDGQLADGLDVTVEYRAISADDTLMAFPAPIASTSVRPADSPQLPAQRDVFPPVAE